MMEAWRGLKGKARRVWRVVVLFCVLRFAVGVVALLFFQRDAIAVGPELTVLVAATLAVYLLVALAVRWWSPARGA
ncbi:MAG TPA: hypothetical protein VEZ14_02495 [Dehalococcoidia bacterium]|nr:hypothetical protein [Dehalococcoidia bacterium]